MAYDFPNPPLTAGQVFNKYTWDGEKWAMTGGAAAGIADAPIDGTFYGRDNAAWVHPAITDVTGLQTALGAKAPLASPILTGNPTAPTPAVGDNDTSIATTAFVRTAISSAPGSAVNFFDTIATASAATIASTINIVDLGGYSALGDGGGAQYRRIATPPTHAAKFQSADGAWWTLNESVLNFRAIGGNDAGGVGAAAGNVTAWNNAIAYIAAIGGGTLLIPDGVFYASSQLSFASNSYITIAGQSPHAIVRAAPTFPGGGIINLNGVQNRIINLTIDGNSLAGASQWVSGITFQGASANSCDVKNVVIQNMSFCGIWSEDNNSYIYYNCRIEDCFVTNVGWAGISLVGFTFSDVHRNKVASTGADGIYVYPRCSMINVCDNYINKSTPPYRVYNGAGSFPGGAEGGFMIGIGPRAPYVVIADNLCYDNRNAGGDGIGLGEDGTEHSHITITGNVVFRTGLFGIDVPGNCTVSGNVIVQAKQSGIYIGKDLGGSLVSATVTGNTIRDAGVYGIEINCSASTIMYDLVIANNNIADFQSTQTTQYGIRVNLANIDLRNASITGNMALAVVTAGFNISGGGGNPPIITGNNSFLGAPFFVTGPYFYATGYDSFIVSNSVPTDLGFILGGAVGRRITVYFNDNNTRVVPDWMNSSGHGADRIVGNANAARAMAAGDALVLEWRQAWCIVGILDVFP